MANESILSVVIPCYNEQETIPIFFDTMEQINQQIPDYTIDYFFVDDGSKDQSLAKMRALNAAHPQRVHYITFSRNFGKESALLAGLEQSDGDLVAVMDVDLQDPPELILKMLQGIQDGHDCVAARRISRNGEPPIRSFFARCFYRLINKISETPIVDGARDFRLMTRQVVDAILDVQEYNRFSKGIFGWVGFDTKYIEYQNVERVAGKTSWSFWKLLQYSLDGIVAFSEAPLSIASFVGIFSFILSFIFLIFIVVRAIVHGDPTPGWPSMVSIFLMIGGLQLFCLGIVGKYIGNIYLEVKNRPRYIIREKK